MPTKAKGKRSRTSVRRTSSRAAPRKAARSRSAARPGLGGSVPAKRRRSPRGGTPALPLPPVLIEATAAPEVVLVPSRTAVAIDGAGPPGSEAFGRSIGAIYGAAYGLKFSRKAGGSTFRVGPLEGRWWAEGAPEPSLQAPPETWRWRLRMAVPDDVSDEELAGVVLAATSRKGGKLEGSAEAGRVFVERIGEARHGRILHVGPYADEPRSFARLDAAVVAAGLRPARSHLEIYLSDPRRVPPARLRTVLLREVLTPTTGPG